MLEVEKTNNNKNNIIKLNEKNKFFNKKRIIGFAFWSILMIVLIVVVAKYIIDLDFSNLINSFNQIKKNNTILIWSLVFAIFLFFINLYTRVFPYWIKIRKICSNIKWYQWLGFTFITGFIQTITPFSIGGESYVMWWLKTKKIPTTKIFSVVGVNVLSWSVIQIIVTWPSFVVYSVLNSAAIQDGTISFVYYLVLSGLFIDLFMFGLMLSINYSRRVHVFISIIFNFFKRIFRFKYLTKEQIIEKYLAQAFYKKEFKKELLQWNNLLIIFLQAFNSLASYAMFVFFYVGFNTDYLSGNWPQIFNIINISTTANNFVPIPNTEGTLQYSIRKLIEFTEQNSINLAYIQNSVIPNTIFTWRFFNNYLFFFISLIGGLIYGLKLFIVNYLKPKIQKHSQKTN